MAKIAVEHYFNGATNTYDNYASDKTVLGKHIRQLSGPNPEDKYAGPLPIAIARPAEASTSIVSGFPCAINYSTNNQYVFQIENTTASATRRVILWDYNISANEYTWKGFITLTFPTATNHTVRGFKIIYDTYTTGNVSVSGTSVTGVGTTWSTDRISSGSRIGFGSNPTVWYEISSIASDTSITLTTSAGTISSGAYVIEEYKALVSTTNATATNGGLFIAKGLRPEIFTSVGTTISAATTINNIRAVYWLADATTVTNTTSNGLSIEDKISWQTQYVYIINGSGSNCSIYKYNIRENLISITTGKTTAAFVLSTGTQVLSGTISGINNGRVLTLNHGPGIGSPSLYFLTSTRVYRVLLTNITSGSTTYVSDLMVEIPPGGVSTYPASSVLSTLEYSSIIDKLIIFSSGANGNRHYVTQYKTNSTPFDYIFMTDNKQLDQTSASIGITPNITSSGQICTLEYCNGYLHISRHGTTSTTNQLYSFPIDSHWDFSNQTNNIQTLITPELSTPGATSYYSVYINEATIIGSSLLGLQPEPYRIYYRTTGITDNSGAWTLLGPTRSLSGVSGSSSIQFMFEFKLLGVTCIPARLFGLTVIYENSDTILSQFEWSLSDSSLVDGTIGFKQVALFGSSLPELTISYYNSSNNSLLVSQSSNGSANGVFEYWNGSAWVSGLDSDVVGTRRRFVPSAGLPANTDIYATLSLS